MSISDSNHFTLLTKSLLDNNFGKVSSLFHPSLINVVLTHVQLFQYSFPVFWGQAMTDHHNTHMSLKLCLCHAVPSLHIQLHLILCLSARPAATGIRPACSIVSVTIINAQVASQTAYMSLLVQSMNALACPQVAQSS